MIVLWSLYNSVDKIQIDDLKTEQVRIVLLSIPTTRVKDWMICKKGDLHWQSILSVPEFHEDVRDLRGDTQNLSSDHLEPKSKTPSAPPHRRPMFEDIDIDSEETLSVMGGDEMHVKERRSARRYHKKLKFSVIQGGRSFETETLDVSMSGMSLEESLPEWTKKKFPATVSFNGHHLKLIVERVAEDHGGNKIQIVDADHWDVLRSWVVGW